MLKKGDGPIDYGWNQRYLVLNSETLMYFKHQYEKAPKGFLSLKQCFVSNIMQMEVPHLFFFFSSSLALFERRGIHLRFHRRSRFHRGSF